jgi:hypothetical protein
MEFTGIDPVALIAYLIPSIVIGLVAFLIWKGRDHRFPKE